MKIALFTTIMLTGLVLFIGGCATAPRTETDRTRLLRQADRTIEAFKERDPEMEHFFKDAHAYAVFPTVGKGGAGIGGAHGRGVAYEQGRPVGFCSVSQATLGLQLGGQSYSQIIFFENADAFEHFTTGIFAFSAQASAVAADSGAAAAVDYERGVAVFTLPRGGLMGEASIGGQRFNYQPLDALEITTPDPPAEQATK